MEVLLPPMGYDLVALVWMGALFINIYFWRHRLFWLKRKGNFWTSFFWKIVYIEMLIVSFLAFFAVLTDYDLGLAEGGVGGGLIGWALAP